MILSSKRHRGTSCLLSLSLTTIHWRLFLPSSRPRGLSFSGTTVVLLFKKKDSNVRIRRSPALGQRSHSQAREGSWSDLTAKTDHDATSDHFSSLRWTAPCFLIFRGSVSPNHRVHRVLNPVKRLLNFGLPSTYFPVHWNAVGCVPYVEMWILSHGGGAHIHLLRFPHSSHSYLAIYEHRIALVI